MQIGKIKSRVNKRNVNKKNDVYSSREWRLAKKRIWKRDKAMCQLCKSKGKVHILIQGTRDMNYQGTVDHIKPRPIGAPWNPEEWDHDDNLRLVSSREHASKSSYERMNING